VPPRKGEDAIDQFGRWIEDALKINDIELLTLKGHVVIEDALKYLLAAKLKADLTEFVTTIRINHFPTLVTLAFAGEGPLYDQLGEALHALNEARNKAAHWIEDPRFIERLASFVDQIAGMDGSTHKWPTESEEQLAGVRWALDEAATAILSRAMEHL
jgi:hypothetical protein